MEAWSPKTEDRTENFSHDSVSKHQCQIGLQKPITHGVKHRSWGARRQGTYSPSNRGPFLYDYLLVPMHRIHEIMVYGIFATHVTLQTLQEYQTTVYQMNRMIIGDHSYKTGHTHQQAMQKHHQPLPLQLLWCMAEGLWQRIQRRNILLPHQDFLHYVSWNHLPEIQMLIHELQAASPEVPIVGDERTDPGPEVRHKCPQCSFETHTIPNLRRHQTMHHGVSQHRTESLTILNMSLQGRPQCNHCHRIFTTWRRFKIHVERNCCQASPVALPSCPSTGPRGKAEAEDYHVTHEAFWPTLVQILQHSDWSAVQGHPEIGAYLTHTCQVCGLWNNRCQELHSHYRLHHAELVEGIFVKSAQITKKLQAESPCALCRKPFKRGHTCTVATQLAALVLHCMDQPGNSLQCELCDTVFATMTLLMRISMMSTRSQSPTGMLQGTRFPPAMDVVIVDKSTRRVQASVGTLLTDGVRTSILVRQVHP